MRDSAGIQIVESHTERQDLPAWEFGRSPLLSIGTVEGREEYRFHWISGGLRLADGTIVLTNGGSSEIRFFGPDGRFIRSVGGKGEGPGEYMFPQGIWRLPGDTLVVWDDRLRRMSFVTREGEFVRAVSPASTVRAPLVLRVNSDGSWIMQHILYTVGTADFAMGTIVLLRLDRKGELTDSIATVPWGELKDFGPWASGRVFGARGSAVAGADILWYGESTDYELQQLHTNGGITRIIRWPGPDRKVNPSDVDAYWDEQLRSQQGDSAGIRTLKSMRNKRPAADQFPAYQDLFVDAVGCLWAKDYVRSSDDDATWTIVAPGGSVLATVQLPTDTRLLEIGDDWALVVEHDQLDVEYVRVYPLQRM